MISTNPVSTSFNQGARVTQTLNAISSLTLQQSSLFGTNRWVDFFQFKLRGHYVNSERLKRYFRAMIWRSRIDPNSR